MSIWNELPKRFLFLLLGVVTSIVVSFALVFVWIVVKGYILGYGDSGPDWINTVTQWIKILSVVFCILYLIEQSEKKPVTPQQVS